MDNKLLVFTGIVVVVTVITSFVLQFLRNSKQNQFMYLLQNNEFDELYKGVDSLYVKAIFPLYNREYIRLNALIMQDRKADVDAQFDKMIPMAASKKAKIDILNKAFEYYVYNEDKKHCEPIYNQIKELGDEALTKTTTVLYDIMILKKSNHIEELEKDIDKLPAMNKVTNAYLLSVQYRNKGNNEKAEYYEDLSKSIVEGNNK